MRDKFQKNLFDFWKKWIDLHDTPLRGVGRTVYDLGAEFESYDFGTFWLQIGWRIDLEKRKDYIYLEKYYENETLNNMYREWVQYEVEEDGGNLKNIAKIINKVVKQELNIK